MKKLDVAKATEELDRLGWKMIMMNYADIWVKPAKGSNLFLQKPFEEACRIEGIEIEAAKEG